MNVYAYPYRVAIVNDGVLKTGLTWADHHGGRFEVVVFLNTPFETRKRVHMGGGVNEIQTFVEMKHRMEIVPLGVADAMVQPNRVLTRDDVRDVLKNVVINPTRLFLAMHVELFADKLTEEEAREFCCKLMARRISRVWKRVNNDPEHPVCRRRLMREFAEMV